MALPEFSPVCLTTDRYEDEGVANRVVGFVVHVGSQGYLVEFSRSDGTTIALLDLVPDEVEASPEIVASSAK